MAMTTTGTARLTTRLTKVVCGLDPSEAVPMDPIPELPTLLLMSPGILSLMMLARKRY